MITRRYLFRFVLCCLGLAFQGCGQPSAQDYVPNDAAARAALATALDAWKAGKAHNTKRNK